MIKLRYLGNKRRLLGKINKVIRKHHLNHCLLGDLFSGSGAVSDYFKDRFQIVANDYMNYAKIFTEAKVNNPTVPSFSNFKAKYHTSPFDYFNSYDYSHVPNGFITKNYSPVGNRKFFSVDNAKRIDFIRNDLNLLLKHQIINKNEFVFLLASLLEAVMRVSNTSGTYGAFFKTWQSRAKEQLDLKPLEMEHKPVYSKNNKVYNTDTNKLERKITGDVAYIDTPYTSLQYSSAYHVLETIANGDHPKIHGKTGIRNDTKNKRSEYSQKSHAKIAFEDLLRQLSFKHVIISYSTQSIIPLNELVAMIKRFAKNHDVEVYGINFSEYNNVKKNHNDKEKVPLKECLIYFNKNLDIEKSPLDYAGSKDDEMDALTKKFPQHISNFVDCCGGAFNVGQNVVCNRVFYNDNNSLVFGIIKMLLKSNRKELVRKIKQVVRDNHLKKRKKIYKKQHLNQTQIKQVKKYNQEAKDNYVKFRHHYNQIPFQQRSPLYLFILTLYSFQHMIRLNAHGNFNVPIGNDGLNQTIIKRILNYHTDSKVGRLFNCDLTRLPYSKFDKHTLFYFDPPYIITSATYNDGKRFKAQWTKDNEKSLLKVMDKINKRGQHFLLSNVIRHHGKTNHILLNWIHKNKYTVDTIGVTGKKYRRVEVVVKNY